MFLVTHSLTHYSRALYVGKMLASVQREPFTGASIFWTKVPAELRNA